MALEDPTLPESAELKSRQTEKIQVGTSKFSIEFSGTNLTNPFFGIYLERPDWRDWGRKENPERESFPKRRPLKESSPFPQLLCKRSCPSVDRNELIPEKRVSAGRLRNFLKRPWILERGPTWPYSPRFTRPDQRSLQIGLLSSVEKNPRSESTLAL